MPVSTMGLGIDRSGRVERYVPPRVIEEAGGGGGGAGPLLSSPLNPGSFTPTATWTSWDTLALPAGTFDVWLRVRCATIGAANNGNVSVSLDGVTPIAGSATALTSMPMMASVQVSTPPVEITLAAPGTLHGGGLFGTGGGNATVDVVQLFARQLA